MKRFQEAQSWSAYEKNQLLQQGFNPSQALSNYQVEFIRSLDEFPEFGSRFVQRYFCSIKSKEK